MKRCIFHLPYELDHQAARARMVRPRKMIQAFVDNGYDVFEVTGYADERKKKILSLKRQIESGQEFDFMYSEANTTPTLLTQPHHYPTHPFLDFGFFSFLKKHNIPIGLFYPDIYWKFDSYGKDLKSWKRFFALANYQWDIRQYEKYLVRFYVPDLELCKYLQSDRLASIAEELPPGADDLNLVQRSYGQRSFTEQPLTVFYVGGLGNHYQMTELIAAVTMTPNTRLILCCRELEWQKEKANLQGLLSDRIEIIHKAGSELEAYYQQTDICSLMFKKDTYREIAKPVKAYEYLGHELPTIATKGTSIGDYVEKNGIGWTIEYSRKAISECFQEIMAHPDDLEEKTINCKNVKRDNTWTARAKQVEVDLLS